MFEIQTHDHHYLAKSIFLGALILVLGVTTWTNIFAQRAIKTSLPINTTLVERDFSKQPITGEQSSHTEAVVIISGDYQGDLNAKLESGSYSTSTLVQSLYSGSINTVVSSGATSSNPTLSGNIEIVDTAIIYARKIEDLITLKGQETRMNMITTMNKFLANYPPEHTMYHTVSRMVDIITLGDVVHKLEYCTQYEDRYTLELFGMPLQIYGTIRYDNQLQKCQITYQYPDKSVHTCRLSESQKLLLAQSMKQKQGLTGFIPELALESVIEKFLKQGICFESQRALFIVTETGSLLSGSVATGSISTGTVTSRWRRLTQ